MKAELSFVNGHNAFGLKLKSQDFAVLTKLANVPKKHSYISGIICLKFDGKKGTSRLPHLREEIVEKITCIYEPGGAY